MTRTKLVAFDDAEAIQAGARALAERGVVGPMILATLIAQRAPKDGRGFADHLVTAGIAMDALRVLGREDGSIETFQEIDGVLVWERGPGDDDARYNRRITVTGHGAAFARQEFENAADQAETASEIVARLRNAGWSVREESGAEEPDEEVLIRNGWRPTLREAAAQ